MYTFLSFFTLSHTQPLHNSHLNTGYLIAKLQANLAWNKAITWLNKFNLTRFLNPFNSCMLSERCNAFSRHSDASSDLPFWGSLREASKVTRFREPDRGLGTLLRFSALATHSKRAFFCFALVVLGSLAGGCCVTWDISPSSEPSVYSPLFLFFLGASAMGVWAVARVGGWGTMGTIEASPPTWAVSKANKSSVSSSSNMASGMSSSF